jgi:hypothetical protein
MYVVNVCVTISRIESHKYTAHIAVFNFSLSEVRNNGFAWENVTQQSEVD